MALFAAQSKVSNEDDSTVQSRQISTEGHHLSCSKMWSRRFPCFQNRSWSIPVYCSSSIQLGLIAGISFLCPGMWNALNGLGGGGLVQAGPANSANVALYGTFSIVGFFAGIATNKLGVRITLSLGGLGYSLYASSLLCYKHTQNSGFLLFAGVQLGACAGVFWSAQSMTAISYPTGRSTGKSISWFWMVYNLGAVLGSLAALGQNLHSVEKNDITDGTFYTIIALSLLGTVLAILLSEAKDVVRSDGTKVTLIQAPSWKTEMIGCLSALRQDYYIAFLFPMFFASNFFYPYQFNTFNLGNFDIRTRSLNNALYWISEIVGASLIGPALDSKHLRRSVKAKLAMLILFLATFVIWGGAFAWQKAYDVVLPDDFIKMDFRQDGYAVPMIVYMGFGLLASAYQTCLLWVLRSLTDDSRKLANFVGFYKGVQSAGGAVSFRVNIMGILPLHELEICWGLLAGSLILAAPITMLKIKDDEAEEAEEAVNEMAET